MRTGIRGARVRQGSFDEERRTTALRSDEDHLSSSEQYAPFDANLTYPRLRPSLVPSANSLAANQQRMRTHYNEQQPNYVDSDDGDESDDELDENLTSPTTFNGKTINNTTFDNNHAQSELELDKRWYPRPNVGLIDDAAFITNSTYCENSNYDANTLAAIPKQSQHPPAKAKFTPKNDSSLTPRPTSSLSSSQQKKLTIGTKTVNGSINHNNRSSSTTPISTSMTSQNKLHMNFQQTSIHASPQLMDIPQHKALERGQRLLNVHVAHPDSPSTIHIMMHEDYATALKLLTDMHNNEELSAEKPTVNFKPQVNRLCATFHEGRWFRCRCVQVLEDSVKVQYIDWGMEVSANKQNLRRLPNVFYNDPACCIQCRLDGVPHMKLDNETTEKCMALLSKDNYEVLVTNYDSINGGTIILYCENENINDQICSILKPPETPMSEQEEFVEQFRHQLVLKVGEEHKALLSSFSGKDDSFYVLIANDTTVAVDTEMTELALDTSGTRTITPRLKTLISAKYEGKWYRAWIKSISGNSYNVLYVDYGNEATLKLSDLTSCPEGVRKLPWLGVRVRLHNEKLSHEELSKFWLMTESNYITIRVEEVRHDHYAVSVRLDYSSLLRLERSKINTPLATPVAVTEATNTVKTITKKVSEASVQTMPVLTPTIDGSLVSATKTTTQKQQPLQIQDNNNNLLINNIIHSLMNEINLIQIRITENEQKQHDRDLKLMTQLIDVLKHKN
ncbi:unnamed protein product [Didymodactylos carnosus]|uniref:Tudor domain-containing protein n=1 Tax=Didymodactylos carnosus TaxID=1234261 RepID=A0A813QZT0_9BILA|nr:unnamed protein product [Didymodactylos carnosus]CAF0774902.1 unnamed protein product [Didymodactylos carnosus]CAF3505799.1 unnamed protein product [Didymodactylos carnosus]CAF3557386.1 unnamed protein product [Didymodactylos carnosus]